MSEGGPPGGLIPAILAGLALRRSGILAGQREPAGGARPPRDPGYEARDVTVRNAALAMAGLALAAVAVVGLMVWTMHTLAARQRLTLPTLTPQQTARLSPPAPNLQAQPYADLDRVRGAAEARLSGYGYRDAQRTRARIPIGRAMDLVVGRSLDHPFDHPSAPAQGGPR